MEFPCKNCICLPSCINKLYEINNTQRNFELIDNLCFECNKINTFFNEHKYYFRFRDKLEIFLDNYIDKNPFKLLISIYINK